MAQQIIIQALKYDTKKSKKELEKAFQDEGFTPPTFIKKIEHYDKTTDCIFEVDEKDIPKLAIHPFHLTGLFRWYPVA